MTTSTEPGFEREPRRGSAAAVAPRTAPRVVTLIADSEIQFLDMALAAPGIHHRYLEDHSSGEPSLSSVTLEDGELFTATRAGDVSQTFSISSEQALEPFLGVWVPVPFMRVLQGGPGGAAVLDEGPSNWARVLVARMPEKSAGPAYRVVLAFDTRSDGRPKAAGRVDTAPTVDDARAGTSFRFSAREGDVAWFVSEAWVDDWLREIFDEHRAKTPWEGPGKPPSLEYLARYLTLLAVLEDGCTIPDVRFAAPRPDRRPIGMDLILDLGHSRTLALIAETPRDGQGGDAQTDIMRGARLLPIRDLSEPWRVHDGVLASRIEFSAPAFGRDALSRMSGRSNAFFWPSIARVGAEAERLAGLQPTSDDVSGLSSPMRYLWDERPTPAVWRFVKSSPGGAQRGAIVSGAQLVYVGDDGAVTDSSEPVAAPLKPRFSRASMATFMIAELLAHAIAAVNAPGSRGKGTRSSLPRRIARILVTVPGSMLERERQSLRRRIEAAIRLVGQTPGWFEGQTASTRAMPEVRFVHDNATNAQLAYLHNEIAVKFRGRAQDYFELTGRRRAEQTAGPSLRFASLDIGGGTTSLGITTFLASENGSVSGTIDVRDGARIGSDDVAKAVVERYLMPALAQSLELCRLADAGDFLAEVLGGRSKGRPSWLGGFGRRFARDFALPVGVALIKAHAESPDLASEVAARHTIGSLLGRGNVAARTIAEELDDLAADEGAAGFSCLAVPVTFLKDDMTATIMSVVGPLLGNVVRLVDGLDCDSVLLSGWMAQLPVVLDTLLEAMPGRAGHIVQLGNCVVGDWFAWRTAAGKIGDTKPLPALGALLATAGENRGGFAPGMRTRDDSEPALLVGRMGGDGTIADEAVLFTLGASLGRAGDTDRSDRAATLVTDPPAVLGARRLPLASWPAMPCYVLDVEAPLPKGRYRLPLRCTIEPRRAADGARDELILVKAMDVEGVILSERELSLRFQTLASAKGYWLDSGALNLDRGERHE